MFQSKIAEWSYSLGFISAAVDLSTGSWTTQNVVGYPREDVKVLGVVSVWFSVLAAVTAPQSVPSAADRSAIARARNTY